jgi:hypothetical protein
MSGDPLESLKTPLGAFEPNVLLAGIEGSVAVRLAYVIICDVPSFLPSALDDWRPTLVVWVLLALVVILLVGLAVEGLAGATERLVTWTSFGSHKLRPKFAKLFGEPGDAARRNAQRWIWKSAEANSEFARRRLRLLAARNTTFVLFASTLSIAVGLVGAQPENWVRTLVTVLFAGMSAGIIFAWVWVAAQQGYTRAVEDAGHVGPP